MTTTVHLAVAAAGQRAAAVEVAGQPVILVVREEGPSQTELLVIVQTHDSLSLGFCLGQGWKQQRSQDGNDRDDDQQFDEGESAFHFHNAGELRRNHFI